jgi:hypothetical protein
VQVRRQLENPIVAVLRFARHPVRCAEPVQKAAEERKQFHFPAAMQASSHVLAVSEFRVATAAAITLASD